MFSEFESRVRGKCLAVIVGGLLALFTANAGEAFASLVAYEGFDTNGALNGQTGGFGWGAGDAWNASSTVQVNSGVATLNFGGSVTPEARRALPTGSAPTWFRFTAQRPLIFGTLTPNAIGGFQLVTSTEVALTVGITETTFDPSWSVRVGNNIVNTTHSTADHSDVWLHLSNDTVRLWINPSDTTQVSQLLNADATLSIAGPLSFSAVGLTSSLVGSNYSSTWLFDDLRVGTSFGAMSAVPEPGMTSLLAVFGAACLLRRRRG